MTSAGGFERFRTVVLADASLQAQLRSPARGGDDFTARVVAAGARHGFAFERADVEAALAQARRDWLERWVR